MKEDHHNKIEVIKSAEQGSVEAQKKLGDYFTSENNQQEAVKWYEMAAKQGDSYSQEQLVRIFSKLPSVSYVKGEITVNQDLKKSFQWLKILSETENLNSLHCLADCYFKGYGTEKSINKAIEILKNMSTKGDVTALYRLADYYFENNRYGQAIEYLEEINNYEPKKGKYFKGIGTKYHWGFGYGSQFYTTLIDSDVNKNIAQCYLMGDEKLEKSFPKYLEYLEKSADKGNRESQHKLIDYLLSQKTKKMDEKAFSLLDGIVQPTQFYPCIHGGNDLCYEPKGNRDHLALYKFASCYFFGRGVDTNPEEAIKWLKEACISESMGVLVQREESLQAKILLGICYINGQGIEKSIDEAITLFENVASENVASENDAIGCLWLAYAYYLKYREVQGTVTAFEKLLALQKSTSLDRALSETEISEKEDLRMRVNGVNSLEKNIVQNVKKSAINFMHENTPYDDIFIVPDIVFPQNIVSFLEGNDNPSAKVILAFYYRSVENTELFLSCLKEADSKLDIIASYTLGLHYEKEKYFDKAVEYFKKIIPTNKNDTYSRYSYNKKTKKFLKISADHEIKLIEYKYCLEEKNKNLEYEIQQKKSLQNRMQKLVEQFTHSLGNVIFPDTIYQVAERLKNIPECRSDTLLLHEAYHAEIIIKLQAELLRQRYGNSSPEKFRVMIRKCRRNSSSGDKKKSIEEIVDYAISRVTARFLNQHYAGLDTIRNKILSQTNADLIQLKQKFEDDILLHNCLSPIEWVSKNLRPIQIMQISPLWEKVFILADSYAEALLFGYFSEILFNAFKYADHENKDFLTLSFAEKSIGDDVFLSCSWSNPTTNEKHLGLGTNHGLEAIKEDLKQLNNTDQSEESLLISQQSNQFKVTLLFKKELLVNESPTLKIKRKVRLVE